MSESIGLLDFIYQVKNELLQRRPIEAAKGWPELFYIDEVELNISVTATREKGGKIKLSVVPFGAEMGVSHTQGEGQTVKVRLTPLLSREEVKAILQQDPEFLKLLAEVSVGVLAREAED